MKADAAARRRREAEELRMVRRRQLQAAEAALETLDESLRRSRERVGTHQALSDHLTGFYAEIDKLAKGRALLEVTDLVVAQVNDIVRDAKGIIQGDAYLDRIKEFAGNNPRYPDVLLVARTIRQCLGRFAKHLPDLEKRASKKRREIRTIAAALKFVVEHDEAPSRDDVKALVGGKVADFWFASSDDRPDEFDFERLDRVGIERCLAEQE